MQYAMLGRTGLRVSRVAFGCGPVSGLMTGDNQDLQYEVVRAALDCGINWFDTAAGFRQGSSERNLGRVLKELGGKTAVPIHVATKVRVLAESEESFESQIRRSVESSLERLQAERVTLLQLHNGMTQSTGDEPFSLSVGRILGRGGIAESLCRLREQGLVGFIGLTGTGQPDAMKEVLGSEQFDTIQAPYNLLNSSAGTEMPPEFDDRNYGNIFENCRRLNVGVFAIRVFAAGALLGAPPAAHTLTTPFFPLSLYEQDLRRAAKLSDRESSGTGISPGMALDYVLQHPAVHSAIIGFGNRDHISLAETSVSNADDAANKTSAAVR